MYEWNIGDATSNCWILLVQTYQATRRAMDVELARHGLTTEQFHILLLLNRSNVALSTTEIAALAFRQRNSVSERLKRMQKLGYIERFKSVEDDRVVMVAITPKGRKFLDGVMGSGLTFAQSLIQSCLTEEDVELLETPLRKIRALALEALGEELLPLPPIFDTEPDERASS